MSVLPRRVDSLLSPDEAMRRYVEIVGAHRHPDPLFRRRLRGTVVNRFVAEREGSIVPPSRRSSRMGRLGRACLYASVATAISVGGVMAAAESALPGDFLYPIKRGIEDMRLGIAPAHLRDDLLTASLAERIDEMSRLVQAGDTARAAELGETLSATHDALASAGFRAAFERAEALGHHVVRLDSVLDQVPVPARRAIERAMSGTLLFAKHSNTPNSRPRATLVSSGRPAAPQDLGAVPVANPSAVDTAGRDDVAMGHGRPPERTPKPTARPARDAP